MEINGESFIDRIEADFGLKATRRSEPKHATITKMVKKRESGWRSKKTIQMISRGAGKRPENEYPIKNDSKRLSLLKKKRKGNVKPVLKNVHLVHN